MLDTIYKRRICKTYNEAERLAITLTEDDYDGWSYKVRELRDGGYVIAIYDEENEFVEYWS